MAFSRYKKSKKKHKHLGTHKEYSDKESELHDVISEFKDYVERSIKGEKVRHNKKRAYELHPSSFPYCGLRHAYEVMDFGGVDEYQRLNYYGDYYTSVGTVVHEVVQDWLGKGGQIIGDWFCKDKKCKGKREFTTHKTCPKCKGEMRYEELGIKFGKYTVGHVDGLWQCSNGRYYVIDYKTSGDEKINKQLTGMEKPFPYISNQSQIESYCVYLEKKYGIKISGWILVYKSRDTSFRTYVPVGKLVDKARKKLLKKRLKYADKHFGVVINLKKRDQLIPLVEEKPCDCMATYEKDYHDKWKPCPLAKNGVCFTAPRLEKTLDKKFKEYRKLLKKKKAA